FLQPLLTSEKLHHNLSVPQLVERILERGEGELTSTGSITANTGKYTGRSPKDKFIVIDDFSKDRIDWGHVNQPIKESVFNKLLEKVTHYLQSKNELYSFKGFAGADKQYRLPIQVINEYAWHNLFSQQLFITPSDKELDTHQSKFTIISAPNFQADPEIDGTNSEAFVIISFTKQIVVIGTAKYAGEKKKSIFSVMNCLLPQSDVLSMHCSSNVGEEGDVALFFGLSGTGKTTLSADAY